MNLGAEQRSVLEPADILGAVDDPQMPVIAEEAGIARMGPAVRALGLGRGLGVAVISGEHAGAAIEYLAALGDLDLDLAYRLADGVGLDLAVGLHAQEHRRLGHAVELFDVDAERAEEGEQVGADRLARGIGHADAAHAEHVLQRPIDQHLADGIEHPILQRDRLAVEQIAADAARQAP